MTSRAVHPARADTVPAVGESGSCSNRATIPQDAATVSRLLHDTAVAVDRVDSATVR